MLIKTLKEINLDQTNFPIFYHDTYINRQLKIYPQNKIFFFFSSQNQAIILFKINKLKFLKTGQFLYTPLGLDGNDLIANKEKDLLEEFHNYVTKNKLADVILPPIHFSAFKSIPSNCYFYKIGIIKYKFNDKHKELFIKKMTPNYRNEIRKLESNELIIVKRITTDIMQSFSLFQETLLSQGLFFESKNDFNTIKEYLKDNYYLIACFSNNQILGSILFYFDKNSAYYFYSGNKKDSKFPGVNKLLILKALEYFNEQGISDVVLGGYRGEINVSRKIVNIQNFKLRFGSEIEFGYHYIKIIHPLNYKIFNFLLSIKSFLTQKKLELINLEGFEINRS
jgi:lipid II:glycine glycyltransferase (peptidoglycan interpeptide bridge formation enzyme)